MSFEAAHTQIRRLGVSDLGVSDLDAVLGMIEIVEEAPHWSREQFERMLSAESSRPRVALVAVDGRDGEVAGFAVASIVPPEAELESIAVGKSARRRGIGRLLLTSLVTQLRTLGIRELHLEVRASNRTAICFYQAENFIQSGVRPRYYTDPEEDAILMTLTLT